MPSHVAIDGVSKTYRGGKQALTDISLHIGSGMFGLLGPNGAGKTTLMRVLATLLTPTAGRVIVNGCSAQHQPRQIRAQLGYLPQQFDTYPQLTVYQFLDYFALLSGLGRERHKAINRLLEQVNLTEQRNQHTHRLSGGMKRRLGIAQALLNNPRLLIVDEPTAGLDPAERVRLRNLLTALGGERVVLLSTHIVEDIASTCDDLAVLNAGQMVFRGSPAQLAEAATVRVWTVTATPSELDRLRTHHTVFNTVRQGERWRVRLLADAAPLPDAEPQPPTLEDGYMVLVGEGGAA